MLSHFTHSYFSMNSDISLFQNFCIDGLKVKNSYLTNVWQGNVSFLLSCFNYSTRTNHGFLALILFHFQRHKEKIYSYRYLISWSNLLFRASRCSIYFFSFHLQHFLDHSSHWSILPWCLLPFLVVWFDKLKFKNVFFA